jgi:hypothetical protein
MGAICPHQAGALNFEATQKPSMTGGVGGFLFIFQIFCVKLNLFASTNIAPESAYLVRMMGFQR